MMLSSYFSLAEMTASDTAARFGIDNTPDAETLERLRHLCAALLDPVRVLAGAPIIVSSGYRSLKLNTRIGGSKTSQHIRGEAADIKCPALGNQQLFSRIVGAGYEFDQLIQEFWTPAGGGWIHISLTRERPNRREMLRAARVNGRVVYTRI